MQGGPAGLCPWWRPTAKALPFGSEPNFYFVTLLFDKGDTRPVPGSGRLTGSSERAVASHPARLMALSTPTLRRRGEGPPGDEARPPLRPTTVFSYLL